MQEKNIMEELEIIVNNQPVFPGDTISHETAEECVNRKWAARNWDGDFVATAEGERVLIQHGGGITIGSQLIVDLERVADRDWVTADTTIAALVANGTLSLLTSNSNTLPYQYSAHNINRSTIAPYVYPIYNPGLYNRSHQLGIESSDFAEHYGITI
jgi:hypothetical protein